MLMLAPLGTCLPFSSPRRPGLQCSRFRTPTQACLSRTNTLPNIRLNPDVTFPYEYFSESYLHVCDNPFARAILLGDDHLPRTLNILSHGNLKLEHLETSRPKPPNAFFPPQPVRRTVAFVDYSTVCSRHPTPLLYSTSVWCPHTYTAIMAKRHHLPFYQVAESLRLPVSRLVTAVYFGTCPTVADFFEVPRQSQLWARDVTFRHRCHTFLHIHQILSPAIQHYVGDMKPSFDRE